MNKKTEIIKLHKERNVCSKRINKTPIVVEIIPKEISQGDTARVVLKKRGQNGLEDFAADKVFNVEIVQGLDYGLILDSLSNDTLTTFSNIPQGFKIIAKDSTGIDSTRIRIKVSTEESFFPSAKILAEEKYQLNIKEIGKEIKDEAEEEKNKTIIPNFIIPGTLYLEGYGDVVVGSECDSYPCNEVILKPDLTYENFHDGTYGKTACIDVIQDSGTGVFQTAPDQTYRSYDQYFNIDNITACYDLNFDHWKFGHKLLLYPYFKVILDTCPNNAIQFGFKPISSISEIKNRYHDSLKLCLAKIDLEGHRNYPSTIRQGGYVFMQVDYSHELAHGEDYKNLIDSLQTKFLYPSLDSLQLGCWQTSDINQAKKTYKEDLIRLLVGKTDNNNNIIFSGFENRLSKGYANHKSGSYSINNKLLTYEKYINSFPIVQNAIDVLLAEFKNIWNCK